VLGSCESLAPPAILPAKDAVQVTALSSPEEFHKQRTVPLLLAFQPYLKYFICESARKKNCVFLKCVYKKAIYLQCLSTERNHLSVGHSLLPPTQSCFSLMGRIPLIWKEMKLALLNSYLLMFDSGMVEIF